MAAYRLTPAPLRHLIPLIVDRDAHLPCLADKLSDSLGRHPFHRQVGLLHCLDASRRSNYSNRLNSGVGKIRDIHAAKQLSIHVEEPIAPPF